MWLNECLQGRGKRQQMRLECHLIDYWWEMKEWVSGWCKWERRDERLNTIVGHLVILFCHWTMVLIIWKRGHQVTISHIKCSLRSSFLFFLFFLFNIPAYQLWPVYSWSHFSHCSFLYNPTFTVSRQIWTCSTIHPPTQVNRRLVGMKNKIKEGGWWVVGLIQMVPFSLEGFAGTLRVGMLGASKHK